VNTYFGSNGISNYINNKLEADQTVINTMPDSLERFYLFTTPASLKLTVSAYI